LYGGPRRRALQGRGCRGVIASPNMILKGEKKGERKKRRGQRKKGGFLRPRGGERHCSAIVAKKGGENVEKKRAISPWGSAPFFERGGERKRVKRVMEEGRSSFSNSLARTERGEGEEGDHWSHWDANREKRKENGCQGFVYSLEDGGKPKMHGVRPKKRKKGTAQLRRKGRGKSPGSTKTAAYWEEKKKKGTVGRKREVNAQFQEEKEKRLSRRYFTKRREKVTKKPWFLPGEKKGKKKG